MQNRIESVAKLYYVIESYLNKQKVNRKASVKVYTSVVRPVLLYERERKMTNKKLDKLWR